MKGLLSLFTALGIKPASEKGSPGMEIVWAATSSQESTLGEGGSQSRFALALVNKVGVTEYGIELHSCVLQCSSKGP